MTRPIPVFALCLSLAVPVSARSETAQAPAKADPAATPAPAAADESTPPRVKEEVTVTATPILEGIRVDSLAGTISTVGRAQIEDLNAQDIASALRRVPGLAISRYNPVGSYGGGDGGAVFVRGQGAGRPGAEISTMVDGVPKFVGVWTHPLLDLLSVDLVHQVDVYKGAQPVLLGNMAFATVDLVSRRRALPGLGARVTAAYGSFDTSALTLFQEGREGRFDWARLGQPPPERRPPGERRRPHAGALLAGGLRARPGLGPLAHHGSLRRPRPRPGRRGSRPEPGDPALPVLGRHGDAHPDPAPRREGRLREALLRRRRDRLAAVGRREDARASRRSPTGRTTA